MTIEGFSDGMDTLLISYRNKFTFGDQDNVVDIKLDEYEKSFLLTQAQNDIVISLYTGRDSSLQSFEETEELRRYLSALIVEAELEPISTSNGKPLGIDSSSKFFTLPENLWFITYEAVNVTGKTCDHGLMQVVPVTQDEYHRIKKNPFRGVNERRALRLDLGEGNVEIVSKYEVLKYYLRYLRKPKPIILVDLKSSDGFKDMEIEGESEPMGCELHEALHKRILERAVEMALISRGAKNQGANP